MCVGTNSKVDPMVRGISESKLNEIKDRLAELKKKKLVPESYTIHNSVQVCLLCITCIQWRHYLYTLLRYCQNVWWIRQIEVQLI